MKLNFGNILAVMFFTIMYPFILLIGYWAFIDDTLPYVAKFDKINAEEFHRNDIVHIEFSSDYLRECDIKSERFIQNLVTGQSYRINLTSMHINKAMIGRTRQYDVDLPIPYDIPEGKYRFVPVTTFSCNPWQVHFPQTRITDTSIEFNIIKG